jgi:hypothetical protein
VKPKRDLVGNRYRFHPNCDLREVLNFNGTVNRRQMRFNLDLACKSFGIVSSKTDGMDGRAVEALYRAGRHEDIALYCLEDVRATSELYLKLESNLLMFEQAFRESEERARRRSEPEIVTSEMSFLDGIAQSSLALASSLEKTIAEDAEPPTLNGRQQAMILEKLVTPTIDEEELQGGL